MAERRMMTKKITDDDHFMSLSAEAQALYLHLNMSADDDGFCNQIFASQFKAHATKDNLNELINAKYIIQFESGVICITHWRIANSLRKDRYTQTTFQEELSQLTMNENGAYSLMVADWLPNGCHMVAEWLPQDSIGKNRIDKISIEESKDTKQINKYGEFSNVELTEEQLEQFKSECPLWKEYIERLSAYMHKKSKSYDDHMSTMLKWYRDEQSKKPKQTASYDLKKWSDDSISKSLSYERRSG